MVSILNASLKPQITILSNLFPITSNKDYLIKSNDVSTMFSDDFISLIHHWLHHQ